MRLPNWLLQTFTFGMTIVIFLAVGAMMMPDMEKELCRDTNLSGEVHTGGMADGNIDGYNCFCVNATHWAPTQCQTALS